MIITISGCDDYIIKCDNDDDLFLNKPYFFSEGNFNSEQLKSKIGDLFYIDNPEITILCDHNGNCDNYSICGYILDYIKQKKSDWKYAASKIKEKDGVSSKYYEKFLKLSNINVTCNKNSLNDKLLH